MSSVTTRVSAAASRTAIARPIPLLASVSDEAGAVDLDHLRHGSLVVGGSVIVMGRQNLRFEGAVGRGCKPYIRRARYGVECRVSPKP